nr:uncharacterized protein LOC109155151 [Ipomoea batatas]
MLNKGSGFGWIDDEKCVTASNYVFYEWVKEKTRSDYGFINLVTKIHDYICAYKHVATYFQNEVENTRNMKIFEEIMQLQGFSQEEIMNAGEHIMKDVHNCTSLIPYLLWQKSLGITMW